MNCGSNALEGVYAINKKRKFIFDPPNTLANAKSCREIPKIGFSPVDTLVEKK